MQKVYLDTCSLNRPLDDKGQLRVALEAEAVLGALSCIEEGSLSLVSSDVLLLELRRTSQHERKVRILKKAAKQKDLRVRVVSPIQLAEEVSS